MKTHRVRAPARPPDVKSSHAPSTCNTSLNPRDPAVSTEFDSRAVLGIVMKKLSPRSPTRLVNDTDYSLCSLCVFQNAFDIKDLLSEAESGYIQGHIQAYIKA